MAGFLAPGPTQSVVFIGAIDTVNRRASGTFADGGECGNIIDTSYPVGVVQVTPAVGETWLIERHDALWRLVAKFPMHIMELSGASTPAEGQTQIGGKGPLELFGSLIRTHGPFGLTTTTTAARPSAVDAGQGAMLWDTDLGKIITSDGVIWSVLSGEGGGGSVGLAGQSIFGEGLAGTKNGSNLVFTTAHNFVTNSVAVFRNGMREIKTVGYTESPPSSIVFTTAPLVDDDLIVDYLGATALTGTAVFGELPAGTKNGINTSFTLAHPYQSATLAVYRNALRETPANFTESLPSTIVFATAPLTGDDVTVDYLISS